MALFFLIIIAVLIYYFLIYRTDVRGKLGNFGKKRCPNCHNAVENHFNVCPICKETLKRKCIYCGEKLDVAWKYCPYCEKQVVKSENK